MSSVHIHAFLIHPGKGMDDPPNLNGREVAGSGKLVNLLVDIFHAQPDHRDFEVTFRPSENGEQKNVCRDLILRYQSSPKSEHALELALRLQSVTDKRPGIGLLFVMTGLHGVKKRTVMSRFPANEAILAEISEDGLAVEFLEQVFIKKMSAYKAIQLEHENPQSGYWTGLATDRQAGGSPEHISNYWLDDFLNADFSETPKAGTRRLAEVLKKAVRAHPQLPIKAEIASAATLAPAAFRGRSISIDKFCDHFKLSKEASDAIRSQLSKPSLSSKLFKFDEKEFKDKVPYRTIEMETGAILTAPASQFDSVFDVKRKVNGEVVYSTEGRISDHRMTRK